MDEKSEKMRELGRRGAAARWKKKDETPAEEKLSFQEIAQRWIEDHPEEAFSTLKQSAKGWEVIIDRAYGKATDEQPTTIVMKSAFGDVWSATELLRLLDDGDVDTLRSRLEAQEQMA